MNRRDFALASTICTATVALAGSNAAAESPIATTVLGKFNACVAACLNCVRHCNECAMSCLEHLAHGHQSHLVTAKLCLDCADVCECTASIICRGGPLTEHLRKACADACMQCADACRDGDSTMQACAKACEECVAACRQ